jgi:hypothetical protein
MLFKVTRIVETGSVTPETVIVDGYGAATVGAVCMATGSFIEMDDVLENVRAAASSESRLLPKTKARTSFFMGWKSSVEANDAHVRTVIELFPGEVEENPGGGSHRSSGVDENKC